MNLFDITERMTRGQLPVNIPTSLALESLIGIHPEREWKKSPYLNFTEFWMNVRTLYRNVCSSYTADMNRILTPPTICEIMFDEWNEISRIVREQCKLQPVLYACNYKAIGHKYTKHTVFRGDKETDVMKAERKRMEKSIQLFLDKVGEDGCKLFDLNITPDDSNSKCLIVTHLAVDLLSYRNFDSMELLESHTGNIKNRSLWYTKYNNGKELTMIPFTQYFLRIFGDKEFFAPLDKALRRELVDLAVSERWNSLTLDSKVRMSLDRLKNPYFKAVVKDMM